MEPGTRLADRFRLDELIASGGMGAVWRAYDLRLGREIAVKVLRAHLDDTYRPVDRFTREAQTLASLRGAGFVEIYDFGSEQVAGEPLWYIAMELIEAGSLGRRLSERERLEPDETMRITAEAAAALDKAHRHGVVHRDVKPGNLLIDADDRVRVVDFGISLMTERTRLTPLDTSFGTITYASPEQVRGSELDPRSDLYSLGAVAYECLAGRPPFTSPDPAAVVHGHLYEEPPPLPDGIPAAFAEVVMHCLRKDPAERFATGADLAAACRAALDAPDTPLPPPVDVSGPVAPDDAQNDGDDEPAPPAEPEPAEDQRERRRPRRLIVIGIVVPVVVASGGVTVWRYWEQMPVTRSLGDGASISEIAATSDETRTPTPADLSASETTATTTPTAEAAADDAEPENDGGGGPEPQPEPSTAAEAATTAEAASSSTAQMPNLIGTGTHDAVAELQALGFQEIDVQKFPGVWYGLEECDVNNQAPAPGDEVPVDEPVWLGFYSASKEHDCD